MGGEIFFFWMTLSLFDVIYCYNISLLIYLFIKANISCPCSFEQQVTEDVRDHGKRLADGLFTPPPEDVLVMAKSKFSQSAPSVGTPQAGFRFLCPNSIHIFFCIMWLNVTSILIVKFHHLLVKKILKGYLNFRTSVQAMWDQTNRFMGGSLPYPVFICSLH